MPEGYSAASAVADFQRARRRADVQAVLAQLSGQEDHLLAYDQVRRQLRAVEAPQRTLEDIPLDGIVGSVGRYQDFSRSFLPLGSADRARWVGVQLAMTGLEGVPPIEVYLLGDAYFVKDGNHRVSVSRQLGASHINAYVTAVKARVPFSRDMDQDDLIIAAEQADFLTATSLDTLRPGADVRVTVPGRYPMLLEHIRVHQYFMGIDLGRPVVWEEAVAHWYDIVYLPVVAEIREHDLLDEFPGRTETDLYLFMSEHRGRLQQEFGWEMGEAQLAGGLAAPRGLDLRERATELTDPKAVAKLVKALLLVLHGDDSDVFVIRHGLALARSEEAAVFALFGADASASAHERFRAAAALVGLRAQLAVAEGELVREVRTRAKYFDVVVAPAAGVGTPRRVDPLVDPLLRRCPRPLLLVSDTRPGITRPLLAYDGGPKAEQALFALAYLSVRRGLEPLVLHIGSSGSGSAATLARAGEYLAKLGVKAELVAERGPVAETIVRVAQQRGCDVVFIGSHKWPRLWEDLLGGVVDDIIANTDLPLLVT